MITWWTLPFRFSVIVTCEKHSDNVPMSRDYDVTKAMTSLNDDVTKKMTSLERWRVKLQKPSRCVTAGGVLLQFGGFVLRWKRHASLPEINSDNFTATFPLRHWALRHSKIDCTRKINRSHGRSKGTNEILTNYSSLKTNLENLRRS